MRCSSFFSVALLSVALPLFTTAEHHGPSLRRHNTLASRKRTTPELQQVLKRTTNARATFYDVGLGACGVTNKPSDFIVALNSCEFGDGYPGPHCFKMITIKYQGKQVQAQITDECPGCPCGGLDLSTGLFGALDSLGKGVLTVDWDYNDGSGGGPAPSPSKPPKPTSTWVPPPPTSSSKWVDPSPWTSQTSSTSKSKPSSTSSSSTSTWSSSSLSWNSTTSTHSSTSTSSSSSVYATPTPSADSTGGVLQNILGLNQLVAQLGGLVLQYES